MSKVKEYEPQPDSYCWFWNNSVHSQYPSIAMYECINVDGTYETDIGPFDKCEQFIGEIPKFITEMPNEK